MYSRSLEALKEAVTAEPVHIEDQCTEQLSQGLELRNGMPSRPLGEMRPLRSAPFGGYPS